MKNLKELLKKNEIKNLHSIKGGDDDGPIDKSKVVNWPVKDLLYLFTKDLKSLVLMQGFFACIRCLIFHYLFS